MLTDMIVWDGNADHANAFFGEDYGMDWEYFEGSQSIRLRDGQRCNVGDVVTKLASGGYKVQG